LVFTPQLVHTGPRAATCCGDAAKDGLATRDGPATGVGAVAADDSDDGPAIRMVGVAKGAGRVGSRGATRGAGVAMGAAGGLAVMVDGAAAPINAASSGVATGGRRIGCGGAASVEREPGIGALDRRSAAQQSSHLSLSNVEVTCPQMTHEYEESAIFLK